MHSSGMGTVHCSGHWGGVSAQGVSDRRVSAQEGVCLGGPRGCLPKGVSVWGCLADIPRGQNDRHV